MPTQILIVDDEEFILEETEEFLTDQGFECFTADNIENAMWILKEHQSISVVLTDIKMPKESGLELIKQVRTKFDREIRFIVMSGHGDPQLMTLNHSNFKIPFLKKPINVVKLLEAIQKTVAQHETI